MGVFLSTYSSKFSWDDPAVKSHSMENHVQIYLFQADYLLRCLLIPAFVGKEIPLLALLLMEVAEDHLDYRAL